MNLFFWKLLLYPFKIFVKQITGLENIPKKPFLLVGNHEGYLAPPIIISTIVFKTNKKIHFLALRLWYSFLYIRLFECVEKGNAVAKMVELLKKRKNVGIFPEGRRDYTNILNKFRTGAAATALLSGALVLPVGIKNSAGFSIRKTEINFGKPLYFKKFKAKVIPKKELFKTINIIMKEVSRLSKKKVVKL